MARERRVNGYELARWVRAVALVVGQNPSLFTILDAQDVSKVSTQVLDFENYLGIQANG